MKLTEEYFIPTITDAGVAELYDYVRSILFKSGTTIPREQWEDVEQEMVLRCLAKLPRYDASKGIPLGGYLYWQCRGAMSIWANHNKRDIPMASDKLLTLKARQDARDNKSPF